MAINAANAGLQKPVDKKIGILWYAPAGTDVSAVTADSDLTEAGFVDAGSITTDGVTQAANSEEPESYLDWNGNVIDSGEATATPSISFALLEVLSENAMKLVYNDASIEATDGTITKVSGTTNPSNKTFILDTRIKNHRVRVIFHECSFASREDDVYANDALYSLGVTYNILTDADGNDITRLYGTIA